MSSEAVSKWGHVFTSGALRRGIVRHPSFRYNTNGHHLFYPLPNYLLWRGNTKQYMYNQHQTARYGEGDAMKDYHQHFSHAKDPSDGCKAHEMEYMIVQQGKLNMSALPKPQVPPNSKPKWHFKSWHMPYVGYDIWRRELEYAEHIPTHLSANYARPLVVVAPQVYHRRMNFKFMQAIRITVCPFMFGFGRSLQKLATDFYRACMHVGHELDREKVSLQYCTEYVVPTIEIEWVDGSVYKPPIMDGMSVRDLIHLIMEQSYLTGDKLTAQKAKVPENVFFDPYKWDVVLSYKLTRRALLKEAQAKAAAKDAAAAATAGKK
eukprot:PhM_4_TR1195/c0_g1_i1/m.17345